MPKIDTKKAVEPKVVEYTREEVEILVKNDAHNQIAAQPTNHKKQWNFVSITKDSYGGFKATFIPQEGSN